MIGKLAWRRLNNNQKPYLVTITLGAKSNKTIQLYLSSLLTTFVKKNQCVTLNSKEHVIKTKNQGHYDNKNVFISG